MTQSINIFNKFKEGKIAGDLKEAVFFSREEKQEGAQVSSSSSSSLVRNIKFCSFRRGRVNGGGGWGEGTNRKRELSPHVQYSGSLFYFGDQRVTLNRWLGPIRFLKEILKTFISNTHRRGSAIFLIRISLSLSLSFICYPTNSRHNDTSLQHKQ